MCSEDFKSWSNDVTLPLFPHTFWETRFGHSRSVLIPNALRCEDRVGLHQAKATLKPPAEKAAENQVKVILHTLTNMGNYIIYRHIDSMIQYYNIA